MLFTRNWAVSLCYAGALLDNGRLTNHVQNKFVTKTVHEAFPLALHRIILLNVIKIKICLLINVFFHIVQ